MTKKIILTITFLAVFLCLPVAAQENATTTDADIIAEQIEVTSADLDINSTGWFSRLWLKVKTAATTDPIKKAELESQKVNIALLLAKNKLEADPTSEKAQAALQKAEEYRARIMAKIQARLTKTKEEGAETDKLTDFLEKYADQQLKHQAILQKLSSLVPAEAQAQIVRNRERHLEKFGVLMNRLQDKAELRNTVKNILQNSSSTDALKIQNLELIEKMEVINPEIKEKIKEIKTELKKEIEQLKTKREEMIKSRREEIKNIRQEVKDQGGVSNLTNEQKQQLKEQAAQIKEENQATGDEVKDQIGDLKTRAREEIESLRNSLTTNDDDSDSDDNNTNTNETSAAD